jgi:hypothetical protein
VLLFVSFQVPPNCLPNFPVEHDSVNLAAILVTHVLAQIPTHMQVVFVSVSVQVCVLLVQACPKREVVVRVAPRERLTLAPGRKCSEPVEMGEENAW